MEARDILNDEQLMTAFAGIAKWAKKYELGSPNNDSCLIQGKTKEMCRDEFRKLHIHQFFYYNRDMVEDKDYTLCRGEGPVVAQSKVGLVNLFSHGFLETFLVPSGDKELTSIHGHIYNFFNSDYQFMGDGFSITKEEARIKHNLLLTLLLPYADTDSGLSVVGTERENTCIEMVIDGIILAVKAVSINFPTKSINFSTNCGDRPWSKYTKQCSEEYYRWFLDLSGIQLERHIQKMANPILDGCKGYLVGSAVPYQSAYLMPIKDDMFTDMEEIRYTIDDILTLLEFMFLYGRKIYGYELEKFLENLHAKAA